MCQLRRVLQLTYPAGRQPGYCLLLMDVVALSPPARQLDSLSYATSKDRFARYMLSEDLIRKFHENAFDVSAFAIGITRARDGVLVHLNQAGLDLFGVKNLSEVVGKTSVELGIWKNEARRQKFIESVRSGGYDNPSYDYTDRKAKDGAFLYSRLFEHDGEEYVLGVTVDVTPMWKAEQALANSEEKFTQLFYASQIPSALIQAGSMKIAEVNWALEELLGYQASELIELGNFSTLWVEPGLRKEFIALLVAEGHAKVITDLRSKQGEVLPVEVSAYFVEIQGEQFTLINYVDLREKRLFEQELMRANEHMENAQALARIGNYVWNLDTDGFAGSNECMRLLGFPADNLADGRKVHATLHEDDRELVMHAIRHSGEFDYECRIYPADGTPMRHLHAWGTIKREEGERIVRGVYQDITMKKEAEFEKIQLATKMQESQRLESLGIMAGGIAHDFNNLLAGILGNADLALLEPELSLVKDRLRDVITASKRAADLTRQLLAYSGKGRFIIQTANLTDLAEEMANLLEISIAKNCMLEFHLEPDLPATEVDSTQIRQVIMNLILNASEAIDHSHGVVRLSTGVQRCDAEYLDNNGLAGEIDPGEYVFLEVSDNGMGMDEETQARIFEPFFTTKFMGRGLGMSAVQGIIKGHSGALSVSSELGEGTSFKVLLPVSNKAVSIQPEEVRRVTRIASGCVLVVDDEQTVRELIQRVLQKQGYDVLLAKDGLEGIRAFEANAARIDLVFLDLTMPDVDGDETFRHLQEIKPDVKAILMSGYNEQDATQRFVSKSLAGFLAKPFLVSDLREIVEEVQGHGGRIDDKSSPTPAHEHRISDFIITSNA